MIITTKKKVVKYDQQGIIRSAAKYAPFLLQINEQMVQKFFTSMAEEQPDGSLILPESIRALFAVEVVWEEVKVEPPTDVDIFAALPSIYDAPRAESPVGESTAAEKAEAVLQQMPEWDDGYSEYVPVIEAEGSDSGVYALEKSAD